MTISPFDLHMMAIALRMAERGLGQTAPNPAVGAVIADERQGIVLARGWTQPGGRPHAETEAIRAAGDEARDATLYVTLEPCAHFGKTPPCADAIIAAGVKRVVVGVGDPDPRTAGQGLARLRAAGIEVIEGVREAEARWVTLGHMLRVTEGRPFVEAKLALDAMGEIARGENGRPVWVTGPEARALGHMMRARTDAILVGGGTVRDDDPELTCRPPGLLGRSPLRVVVTRRPETLFGSKILATAHLVPVLVAVGGGLASGVADRLREAGAAVAVIPDAGAELDVRALLTNLAERGITRLLVEGGPGMWAVFAQSGVVDAATILQAGETAARAAVALPGRWLPGADLRLADRRRIGNDFCFEFRRR